VKKGRPQAKDIRDDIALASVDKCCDHPADPPYSMAPYRGKAMWWDVTKELGLPEKVVLAKMKALKRRGLITGCPCGCRGDFELTKAGDGFLARTNNIVKELEAIRHLAKDFYPSE
jgi:hypothetical protein